MNESEEAMSTGRGKIVLNPFAVKKPKKRSLVERELETNMTARITSPMTVEDGVSTSRYGRARRMKSGSEALNIFETLKSPKSENTPLKVHSPSIKVAANSSFKTETPKKALETSLDDINSNQNKKLINSPEILPKSQLSGNKLPKVYIRTDLIQNRDDDDDDDVVLIKDLFSPKSGKKKNKVLKSSEKRTSSFTKQNSRIENASVVKALDFDGKKESVGNKKDLSGNKRNSDVNKKGSVGNKRDLSSNKIDSDVSRRVSDKRKRDSKDIEKDLNSSQEDIDGNKRDLRGNKADVEGNKRNSGCNKRDFDGNKKRNKTEDGNKKDVNDKECETLADSDSNKKRKEMNDIESPKAKTSIVENDCPYQVGDLAWARMGTFPYWPCLVTRDPESEMFVRKKLFGRVEHDIFHVTFFADNGRRSWVVDNMLRKYSGLDEFLLTREKFTSEDKKRDPRLYYAFFISEKKQSLWNTSVEEAEALNREPKDLRIDIFNDLLYQSRASKKLLKSGKITRTNSDVSLSESLYDSLFSEDDSKTDDSMRLRNKTRNKSLDVSDVVTACLDNMAAKTGNIKIQRQSHMDRWLQKAKSKTPEKVKAKIELPTTPVITPKVEMVTPTKITPQDIVEVTKEKSVRNNKKKKLPKEVKITKVYSLRRSHEPQNALREQTSNKTEKNEEKDTNTKEVKTEEIHRQFNDINHCPNTESTLDSNKEITTDSAKDLDNKNVEPIINTINSCSDDNDDILNAINELLDDTSVTESDLLTKPGVTTEPKEKEVEKLKDKGSVNNLENKEKTPEKKDGIIDSQVINENDTCMKNAVNDSSPSETVLSPIKKSTTENKSTTPADLKANESEIESTSETANHSTPKKSPLKANEMVSIPENVNITDDDDSNFMTKEYNPDVADLQDHNSNLTNISSKKSDATSEIQMDNKNKTKYENLDLVEKEVVENKINSEGLTNSNESIQKNEIEETSIKKPDEAISINMNDKQENPDMPNVLPDISTVIPVEKHDVDIEKPALPIETFNMSIDELEDEDVSNNEKDLLNESFQSVSILQIDGVDDFMCDEDIRKEKEVSTGLSVNAQNECILKTYENNTQEVNSAKIQADENENKNGNESNSFLDNSHSIDVKNTAVEKNNFFCEVNMNIPPDLTPENFAAKADLLNVQNNDSEYEDSEDEPSPEYEPLGDEITEDFRQHMKCIESSITDKKDEAQLVKVCNEIAILEESKAKLVDIKTNMNKVSPKTSIKLENEALNGEVKSEKVANDETEPEDSKAEIRDGLNIINRAVENRLKSPLDKKKHNLSLKKDKSRNENTNTETMNPRYKTIDQIEEIMKNKPKRLPIENGEVSIPEIKENGYITRLETPEQPDDDFDIDEVSVNSEDSEVSLPQEKIPTRRSLRAKPCRKSGLEDPEFLTYMELRQDDLMEQHPELSMDDIVLYLYKTFAYTQNLKSDIKIEESPLLIKTIKQETPPSKKKSKKTIQPKSTIENFFRVKYRNAKKIDFDSERSESSGSGSGVKRHDSISPVDSGIGKDSNESYSSTTSNTKSLHIDLTEDITKDVKVELLNDIDEESKTPKKLWKRILSPKEINSKMSSKDFEIAMSKRVPVVVISPIKEEHLENKCKLGTITIQKQDIATKLETDEDIKNEPTVDLKLELDSKETNEDAVSKHEPHAKQDIEITTKQVLKTTPKTNKDNHDLDTETRIELKHEKDDTESIDSDSELPLRQLRSKVIQENKLNELKKELLELKDEVEDTTSVCSDNLPLLKLKPKKADKSLEGSYEDPEFLKYLELKQDNIMEDNPQLSQNEIKAYLYKTWIYEKDSKTDMQKNDDIESSNLVKGLTQEPVPTRKKRKPKTEKHIEVEVIPKEKPKRKTVSHYYNEAFISDIEDELEVFEIFKTKKTPITVVSKPDSPKKEATCDVKTEELNTEMEDVCEEINTLDEIELYFKQLTSAKPSVFKGLIREKVCEICEDISNLIKCKGCNGTFHYDCVKKATKTVETPVSYKGRKKKKKPGRKPKNLDDSDHSEDRDISEENISFEEPALLESITMDAATLEAQIEAKMKEIMGKETQLNYDSYSSDDGIDWTDTIPGKCELIDVKLKRRTPPMDYTNFYCNNCQKHSTPVCFVCKSAVSKTDVKIRQKCNVAHCYNYYHLGCLDHWPQTQFNAGEWSKSSKKSEQLEALTCPRHVCHTCVSDDPRGCKTRFSGDKLARCVRCPATYHSFNKCLPAGTQILTASLIICPRHYEHRPGKVPCHVNTGWCFICALGGSLICCEYCPTSFHAECLNIKPPEGNYMCEDCETGRLPLYGEMVWVKLGHYRWWPGVILHPSEIPDNIMAVKHGLGEFVVRFFGQYDHYWVNRGRVFPYQEGDSGRISSQKSKIDVAFTTAMEHAQRAFEILKNAEPDDDESLDIASSLLPPHYVKLKCNKPIGSLLGRKIEDPSLSLTQCECNPAEIEPCGPNSQCINRMLLTECGPTCRAGDRCSNRAFEKRLYPKLTPYRASLRGWGLKTLQDIKAGQFVIEYVGELIDEEEFQRRMRRKHEIRDENFYFLTLDKERMIDAGPKGNLARFMNHCCEPNCETQKWTVLGDIRVGLFAIDDIKANSEVTFNYNLECTGIEKKRCLCGAKRCSGYIGAKPKQLDESQRKKNGITKRKYTKRKNIDDSPTTSSVKLKVKKPVGRPPKPKELTEIEKDLLIIKSATVESSDESRCQSVEEKNLKPLKKKSDSMASEEASNLNEPRAKLESNSFDEPLYNGMESKIRKLDSITKEEGLELNGTVSKDSCRTLKRKLDLNSIEEVTILSEPSAKRIKCDKQIEVGD